MATNIVPDPIPLPPVPLSPEQSEALGNPRTALQLRARFDLIQSVMHDVMKKGVDYGTVGGTTKPTLLKPGAEKLALVFRLSADDPTIEELPSFSGSIRYRLHVPIRSAAGALLAVGVGECSTDEEKYRWRRPVHVREYDAAAVDERRIKWSREGDEWKQVRVHPADVANTVLKMAHKRGYVHGVLMATGASAIFTQDAEDLPDGLGDAAADEDLDQRRAPIQAPKRKGGAAPATGAKVNENQAKRLFAIAMGAGWKKPEYRDWLKKTYGVDRDTDLLQEHYEAACKAAEAGAGGVAPEKFEGRQPGDEDDPGFLR